MLFFEKEKKKEGFPLGTCAYSNPQFAIAMLLHNPDLLADIEKLDTWLHKLLKRLMQKVSPSPSSLSPSPSPLPSP